jgi:preprotein translocase subunit YajC
MRIEDMSIDPLLEMNRIICLRIDQLQDQENIQALSQLQVGSKVTFSGWEGPKVEIVTKINRKSVIVLAEDDGMKQYKVSPCLLRLLRGMR